MPGSARVIALIAVLMFSSLGLSEPVAPHAGALVLAASAPTNHASAGTTPTLPAGPWPREPAKSLIGAQGMEPAGASGNPATGATPVAPPDSGRAGVDVAPVNIQYLGPDPAVTEFGAAQVGMPTQFVVTVANLGTVDSGPVSVSIKVSDYFLNVVGQYTTSAPPITAGGFQTVPWSWNPAYSTKFSVNATATAAGDTNTSNDVLLLPGLYVEKWLDLCNSPSGWSGDIDAARWHITNYVPNDPAPQRHSIPQVWHCGPDGYYDNSTDASLVTPPLDLTRMNPNYYALFDFNYYGRTVDKSDYLACNVTDDGGKTWVPLFAVLFGGDAQGGWFDWVTHWIDYNDNHLVDPNEPHQNGLDISKYIGRIIQIKLTFVSDETMNDMGFYLDDFVLRGTEDLNDVAVLKISAAGVESLGTEQTYTTTVKNLGQDLQPSTTAYFDVTDGTALTQNLPALPPGDSAELQWKWTPSSPGNFTIDCRVAPALDEVPGDNSIWRPAHVAAGEASILLVDDDSGPGNNGALRSYIGADVEWGVESSLTFAEYDCYLVANDESGPPLGLLERYGLVIWLTGYDDTYTSRSGTLTPGDIQNLSQYMDGGGRLWLSSFEVLWDTWAIRGNDSFVKNYLHVRNFTYGTNPGVDDDWGTPASLDGVEGDPIGDGPSIPTVQPPAGLWDKTDRIDNASDAPGIFYENPNNKDLLSGPFNSLRYSGVHKLVFFAFEFTFIGTLAYRDQVSERVVSWLWRGVSLSPGTGGLNGIVSPGSSVSYNITLVNSEPREWTVELLAPGTLPQGWNAEATPSVENGSPSVTLPPSGSLAVILEVGCPTGEPAGERVTIDLVARMAGSPISLSVQTETTVVAVAAISLDTSAPVQTAVDGEEAVFTVSVTNMGNYDNRVNLTVTGEAAQWSDLSRSSMLLSGGGRAYVQLTATVPDEALAGGHDLTLTAVALNGSSKITVSLDLSIMVNATRSLKIEKAPTSSTINLAQTLRDVISVEISNYGNRPETARVSLSATFQNHELWDLPTENIELGPFEKDRSVDLGVGAPATAAAQQFPLSVRVEYSNGDVADQWPTIIVVQKPDLSISAQDLTITPSRLGLNDSLEIAVMVHNLGSGQARNVNVSFTLDDVPLGRALITDSILPGGAVPVSFFHRGLRYGDNQLDVSVDPDGSVPELSRSNNGAVAHIFGYQADLLVGQISFRAIGRGPLASNSSIPPGMVELVAMIGNAGQYCEDVENVEVNFTVDGTLAETRVVSVPANSEVEATTLWVAKKGVHRIQVAVDPGNRTSETVKTNNVAELTVKVVEPAGTATVSLDWLLLLAGVVLLALVAGAFVWQSRRPADARDEEEAGMSVFRARPGKEVVCGKCGKPIAAGEQYYKCGCDTRYHMACAPDGKCPRCAAEDEEE